MKDEELKEMDEFDLKALKLKIEEVIFEKEKQKKIEDLESQIEHAKGLSFYSRGINEEEFDYTHR